MIKGIEKLAFGFWLYLMSDVVLFASLFATYAALVASTAGGPDGAELFSLPLVFLQTNLLLLSSFTMGVALMERRRGRVLLLLLSTLVLGLAFLALEITEFSHLIAEGAGPGRSAFLSAFFALVGTHGLHIAFGSLWMIVVGVHVWLRGVEHSRGKLLCLALFWHFLDVIWICIFTFVYLFGLTW